MFFMEKYGKLSLNYPCYPFFSGALTESHCEKYESIDKAQDDYNDILDVQDFNTELPWCQWPCSVTVHGLDAKEN